MTDKDTAFADWYRGEFGYALDPKVEFGQDAAFRSAFEAGAKFERDRARRLVAETQAISKVQNIPVPWNFEGRHTVVDTELPPDRLGVVDLVFSDKTKLAETLNTIYVFNGEMWQSPRIR